LKPTAGFSRLPFHRTEKTAGSESNLKLIWIEIFAILPSLSAYPVGSSRKPLFDGFVGAAFQPQ